MLRPECLVQPTDTDLPTLVPLGELRDGRLLGSLANDWLLWQSATAVGQVTRLPTDDRELLTLVAWDGLRTDEAAALLGITSAAARSADSSS